MKNRKIIIQDILNPTKPMTKDLCMKRLRKEGWLWLVKPFIDLDIMTEIHPGSRFNTIIFKTQADMNLFRLLCPLQPYQIKNLKYRLDPEPSCRKH